MSHPTTPGNKQSFGRRSNLHTITITKGDKTRKFTVRPAYVATVSGILGIFVLGYLGATAYLVMRDDLIGASLAKQARLQHKYEARITALRSRIDLITSQQLVEQQAVESRVQELLKRQSELGSRSDIFGDVLKKAATNGLTPATVAVPKSRPQEIQANMGSSQPLDGVFKLQSRDSTELQLGALSGTSSPFATSVLGFAPSRVDNSNTALAYFGQSGGIFNAMENSLQDVETKQISALKELRSNAISKTKKIARILKNIGVSLPGEPTENIGGPLVELGNQEDFATQITALDAALANLNKTRKTVSKLPVGNPLPGQSTSSRFGRRVDPFERRAALHSGIDLRAPRGMPVRATGDGKVVKAGRNGGYGLMVEVVHGNGLITRYAHMSKVLVKVGQRIKAGVTVGKVGSTGRSTGPHLHYEVRYRGKPQNPARYVRAGTRLKSLL